jgi:hypothetical protein
MTLSFAVILDLLILPVSSSFPSSTANSAPAPLRPLSPGGDSHALLPPIPWTASSDLNPEPSLASNSLDSV